LNTGSSEIDPVGTTTLLMGFHCHQPVGNFESVLRQGCRVCYGPLLEELVRHQDFKFSMHMSGHLLEWIEAREKGIFDLLTGAARKGQAELFTAGFYEPVLNAIPPADALEQIMLLSDLIQEMSGIRPEGLWLTERIWDPSLVPLLHQAGICYTIVDDNHLAASGSGNDDLSGYFITDTRGKAMALYPISQSLRYATPFKPVPQALEAVAGAGAGKGRTAIVFDDGEKFGMWPDTADWVYGRGWLRDFLSAVCESENIRTSTFREHFHDRAPMGRVHLASGSYAEMEEWTLAPEDARAFNELVMDLQDSGRGKEARRFLKGGLWADFFIKYSESNNMHKKMIHISERTVDEGVPEARHSLFMGQCNDAYWHGIFGGLYLPVLRNGIKRALNEAEKILDERSGNPSPRLEDINLDGYLETELRTPGGIAVITALGGHVYELSDKESLFDLLSTLTRRVEHYHLAAGASGSERGGDVTTIHESVHSMSEEARRKLVYDRYPRYAFIDHFLPSGTAAEDLMNSSAAQWGDFAGGIYDLKIQADGARAVREGSLSVPGRGPVPLRIEKLFELKNRTLTVNYNIGWQEDLEVNVDFGCEVNLHLPSQMSCEARLDGRPFSLGEPADLGDGNSLSFMDPALNAPVTLTSSLPGSVWIYPVQTVSQSEGGFEVTWQGCSLGFRWNLAFPDDRELSLNLSLEF